MKKGLMLAAMASLALANGAQTFDSNDLKKVDRSPRSVSPLDKKQIKARKLARISKESRRKNQRKNRGLKN